VTGRKFVWLLAGVLGLGLSYGAVFGGGALYGRSTAPEGDSEGEAVVALPSPTPQAIQQAAQNVTPADVAQLRERLTQQFGGQLPPQVEQRLSQFQSGGSVSPGQAGAPGFFFVPAGEGQGALTSGGASAQGPGGALRSGGGITGEIVSISGNTVVLDTATGQVPVSVDTSTAVQVVQDVGASVLKTGDDVVVRGVRNEDGSLRALNITLAAAP
jgi:hypothetical protein